MTPLTITLKGQDAHGVTLISPGRDEFDQLARPLLGERIADIGLKIKPMLVIVANDSPQTIVSLSLIWRVASRGGPRSTSWSHTSFPEFVCGDTVISTEPDAVPPGHKRIEANGVVVHGWGKGDPYYDQFLPQFADEARATLAGAVSLEIDLNAVIFADGTLVGDDDESKLELLFDGYVRAKQWWYGGVAAAIAGGRSVAEAFEPLDRYAAESSQQRRSGHMQVPFDREALCKELAASDVQRWRRRHTENEIRERIMALRLDAFVIRRRSSS